MSLVNTTAHTLHVYMYYPKIKVLSEFLTFYYTPTSLYFSFYRESGKKVIIACHGIKIIIPDFFTRKTKWSSSLPTVRPQSRSTDTAHPAKVTSHTHTHAPQYSKMHTQ